MLTVLLATRNRGRILASVLESFCHLQPPMSGWKLVVIDNGSTDQTSQVLASFTDRLPLCSLHEPKPGKNVALNTGLDWVEGDLAIFTDDDVFPRADWLIELRNAADTHPAYSMFGGTILPRWETQPPAWIRWVLDSRRADSRVNDLRGGPVYTITDPLLREGPVASELVFGPNMAIRTSVFQAGIRFDSCIGPRGCSYPMGSETELLLRLSRQGHRGWHVPKAVVEHFVREEQLKKAWILQRAIRFGRGQYRLSPPPKLWIGIPRHLFRDIPKEGLRLVAARLALRKEALFRSRWRFNYLLGLAIEARNTKQ
jgi:glycosyltransferase involved in cell wall biosynthesis